MAERRRCPSRDLVAIFADVAGCQVRSGLARRFGAIVTAKAIGADAGMGKSRGCPSTGFVAVFTDIVGGDVVRRLPCRLCAVVAAGAV